MRQLLCVLPLLGLAACQQLSLSSGRFSCDAGVDCGSGFECRPQFAGGSRCFRAGECVDDEVCDGADQNCDGRIDEAFPEAGEACLTANVGQCAAGSRICVAGTLACLQSLMPAGEQCNGLDDDCDGAVDEVFDFTSDESNCGGCALSCDAGTTCLTSQCQESLCDDGADNDLDGVTDCFDRSCLGQVCVTPMPPSWRCGALQVDAGISDAGPSDAGISDGGDQDAGLDAGTVDAGPLLGCFAPEQDCGNGLDDDGDGEADCLDVDCAGLVCASGTICTNRSCPGPG